MWVMKKTLKNSEHDFSFSHKHITSHPPPLCTVFVCDLASGWAGSSGKQNKAIWFLRPYAAPTLNNRPGETTLSRSQSQHCSLLIPALSLSISEELTSPKPFKYGVSNLNFLDLLIFVRITPFQ